MKRIIIILMIFLVGCSSNTSESDIYYNVGYDSGTFMWKDKIIYYSYEKSKWTSYDIKSQKTVALNAKVTDSLREVGFDNVSNAKMFPHNDGIYTLKEINDIESRYWILEDTPNNSSVPRKVVDSQGISLIDARTMSFITKTGDNSMKNNNYSPDLDVLESQNVHMLIPFNGYMYQIMDFGLMRSDLFGNKVETLDIKINKARNEISFMGDDIYYLDLFYDVRKYNTSTKEDTLLVEDVYMFQIDNQGIYYTSLADSSFNFYDFKTNEKVLLTKEYGGNMKTDFEFVYYLSGYSGIDLYRTSIKKGGSELVYPGGYNYVLLEDSLFIIDKNDRIELIKK